MLTSCQSPGASVNLICNVEVRDSFLQATITNEERSATANTSLNIFIDNDFNDETIQNCAINIPARKTSKIIEELYAINFRSYHNSRLKYLFTRCLKGEQLLNSISLSSFY